MYKRQNVSLAEVFAAIRNKLQTSKTTLELLKAGKEIPKKYIDKAFKDLEKVEETISIEENLLSHARELWKKGVTITTITRNFKETVQARALRDQKFREGILRESIECMLSGDVKTGKALIRDYINATVGFKKLSRLTHKDSKV
jgi:hypothetical protein